MKKRQVSFFSSLKKRVGQWGQGEKCVLDEEGLLGRALLLLIISSQAMLWPQPIIYLPQKVPTPEAGVKTINNTPGNEQSVPNSASLRGTFFLGALLAKLRSHPEQWGGSTLRTFDIDLQPPSKAQLKMGAKLCLFKGLTLSLPCSTWHPDKAKSLLRLSFCVQRSAEADKGLKMVGAAVLWR